MREATTEQSGLLPPSKTTVEETQVAPDSVVQEGGELAGIDPVGLRPRVARLGGFRIESWKTIVVTVAETLCRW